MFGMLDYRAHKLYRVLVYPVSLALLMFEIVCLPIIAYLIAIKRPFFTLKIVDASTIEVGEGNISTRFFQCSPNSPSL
jgi:hypothetical protein